MLDVSEKFAMSSKLEWEIYYPFLLNNLLDTYSFSYNKSFIL